MRYKVTFYQCAAVYEPESYRTKREAEKAAAEFLRGFTGMPGHRRQGSIRRDGYARYIDGTGATEVLAEVHPRGQP